VSRARKRGRGGAAIALLAGLLAFSACTDDSPRPDATPERIISLVPAATETLYLLGVGDRVVARSTYCDHPPEAEALPALGDAVGVNAEAVFGLRPDLVFVAGSAQQSALGPLAGRTRIETVLPESVAGTRDAVLRIASLVGEEEKGREIVAMLDRALSAARERSAGRKRRRVLFVVEHEPLVVAGAGSFVGELLTVLGAENVAGDLSRAWPALSLETVVARDPEVVIDAGISSDAEAMRRYWNRFPSLTAVREGRVVRFDEVSLIRPGPRLPRLLERLEEIVR